MRPTVHALGMETALQSAAEIESLRSQNAIARSVHGRRRNRPCASAAQGVAKVSSVLRSPRAIAVGLPR